MFGMSMNPKGLELFTLGLFRDLHLEPNHLGEDDIREKVKCSQRSYRR